MARYIKLSGASRVQGMIIVDADAEIIDLEAHDKQIRNEVVEEFREKVFGKLCRLTLSMYNFKLYDDALQEAYKEMKGEQ